MYLIGTQFRDFGETVFRDFTRPIYNRAVNFAIQALSTSFFFFAKSLNLLEFFLHLTFSIPYVKSLQINVISQ